MSFSTDTQDYNDRYDAALRDNRFQKTAWAIALFGLFPFLSTAVIAFYLGRDNGLHASIIDLFTSYSIIVLGFMGGARWGIAVVRNEVRTIDLWMSILPPLIAWALYFLPKDYAILCLLVAYCGLGAWDSLSAYSGVLPKWFGKLRVVMTLLVAACHIVVFVSLF